MTPLTTISSVKTHLGVREGVTEFDARLRELVDIASAQIEAVVRRDFSAEYQTVGTAPDEHLDVPAPIRLAATVQALALWKKLDPNNVGLVSERSDNRDAQETAVRFVSHGLVPEAMTLVLPYRRMLFGGVR